ncbi:hypothetical protein D4R42_01120 [bacterium]|nr:MAG: hypothetical protein D4R42_01120 [bacterium]
MNKSVKIIGTAFIGVTAIAMVISPALAYRGDYSAEGPNCSPERHTLMTEAFKNNDYEAWSELMNGRGRVADVITAENFPRFAEAHRLAQEGDFEGANQIRGELGLRTSNGEKVGANHGKGQGRYRE